MNNFQCYSVKMISSKNLRNPCLVFTVQLHKLWYSLVLNIPLSQGVSYMSPVRCVCLWCLRSWHWPAADSGGPWLAVWLVLLPPPPPAFKWCSLAPSHLATASHPGTAGTLCAQPTHQNGSSVPGWCAGVGQGANLTLIVSYRELLMTWHHLKHKHSTVNTWKLHQNGLTICKQHFQIFGMKSLYFVSNSTEVCS